MAPTAGRAATSTPRSTRIPGIASAAGRSIRATASTVCSRPLTITAPVRELTQKRAKQTGKPYPLGLRLPCRLGLLKAIGLDVKAMADAGLIDFVSFSNFWQTSWDEPLD